MALGIILQFLGLFDFHMLWKAWEPHLKTESEDCGEPYALDHPLLFTEWHAMVLNVVVEPQEHHS